MADPEPRCHINEISPELLSAIFDELEGQRSTLFNCMLCCRTWHAYGQPRLYQHVVLSRSGVTKYTRLCPSSPHTDGKVQSLTLRMDAAPSRVDWALDTITGDVDRAAEKAWQALTTLASRMSSMTKLTSLSVLQTSERSPIPYEALETIVTNMPKTCVCLELDVAAARRGCTHLCLSLIHI